MRLDKLWIVPALATLAGAGAHLAPTETPLAIQATAEDPDDLVDEVLDEYQVLYDAYTAKARAAKTQEERTALRSEFPDPSPVADRLLEIADAHPKTGAAARALVWVNQRDRRRNGNAQKALETLLADHTDSDQLAEVLPGVTDAKVHARLLEASKNENVRGIACFSLAKSFKDSDLEQHLALMERCAKEFPSVAMNGRLLGDLAKGAIFEAKHLQIGKPAPEISGEDIDGVGFKLSDYRGKVILLDFWGHW